MKSLILTLVCLAGLSANARQEMPEMVSLPQMPEVNSIQNFRFERPYSCRFDSTYVGTALFLTSFSKQRNSPDLLLNGACGSEPYFQSATAGNDQATLIDLGNIDLKPGVSIEALIAYRQHQGEIVASGDTVPALKGHTYAVLVHKDEIRARFTFKVLDIAQDGPAMISYSVESYRRKFEARSGSPWMKVPAGSSNSLLDFNY